MLGDSDGSSSSTPSGSDLRSRLVEIEGQMAELESQLARLRIERDMVQGSVDSIVYPILTLPPEIISEIFIHSVDNPFFHDVHIPLRLASVCRAWRAIALSTCALWAHFDVTSNYSWGPNAGNLPELLQSWLPRARSVPLGLRLEVPTRLSSESQDEILSILSKYSAQWSSLDLKSPKPIVFPSGSGRTPLSSLQKIAIEVQRWPSGAPECITAFLDAPQLRKAHLTRLSLAQISLPWIQLANLELFGQSLAQCLDILEQTPNLESLTFAVGPSFGAPTPTPSFRTMPCLRIIKFLSDSDSTLLDYLTLPALERLNLWQLSWEGSARVAPLVARSGCSVRALHLLQTSYLVTSECIWNLDSLTEFTMRFPSWSPDQFTLFVDLITESRYALPALEALNIDWCEGDIDIYALATMLSARCARVEGTAQLKSFRLSFKEDHRDGYVQRALDQLLDLRVQGLEMDIHGLPKWSTQNINSKMMEELDSIDDEI
ncbi:hypothetical protein FB451DRAFT_1138144 [Mycena latifolia]|nr:hypothetical protein FB451DRAFT_1138144 [Mycena latifolia]